MQSDQPDVNEITAAPRPSHDEIALRAYQLWEERGRADGSDKEDWYLAGAAVTSRLTTFEETIDALP